MKAYQVAFFTIGLVAAAVSFQSKIFAQSHVPTLESLDPVKIIDRAIEAIGGAERVGNIKAFRIKSRGIDNRKGERNTVTQEIFAQNSEVIRMTVVSIRNAYIYKATMVISDHSGWRKSPLDTSEPVKMSDPELFRASVEMPMEVLPVTLLELKSDRFKLQYRGDRICVFHTPKGDLKGTARVIKATRVDGESYLFMFDMETYLLIKQIGSVSTGLGDLEIAKYYTDYKDFNGLKVATTTYVKELEETEYYTETVEEFEILNDVDPALFGKPK